MKKKKQLIRLAFNEAVFSRDNFTCTFCSETSDLDAHHITDRHLMPAGGYVKENGITLCSVHHYEAEMAVEGMQATILYDRIGSSYEEALRASERLLGQ